MNTITANEYEQSVSQVFEHCITKIAAVLKKNFNPTESKSIMLFRLFCMSIKTRNSWIKSTTSAKNKNNQNPKSSAMPINQNKDKNIDLQKVLSFDIPQKNGAEYQHPIKPEHMKSGLLMKR